MNISFASFPGNSHVRNPSQKLGSLVLRFNVHMLPCSKLWGPGTGKPDSPGRLHSSLGRSPGGQGPNRQRRALHCSRSPLQHFPPGCWETQPTGTAGESVLSHLEAAAYTPGLSPSPSHQPFHEPLFPTAALGLLVVGGGPEPISHCPRGLPGSARPRKS